MYNNFTKIKVFDRNLKSKNVIVKSKEDGKFNKI